MQTNLETIRSELLGLSEAPYARFTASLIPGATGILGVRLPHLRKIAKRLARGNWKDYLDAPGKHHFEERMLHGMLIGTIPADIETVLAYTADFIPLIDNWSVCDSFCAGLTCARKHQQRVWDFLQPCLTSGNEYELRFGSVMLLDHYLNDEYISRVLHTLEGIRHEAYYVHMGIAWALSTAFVRYPELTLPLLQNGNLDKMTHNKTIQKIVESLRVPDDTKNFIRTLKRK